MKKIGSLIILFIVLLLLGGIVANALESAGTDCPECGASMHTRLWKKYTYVNSTNHRVITDYYLECNDCGYMYLDNSTIKFEPHSSSCTLCSPQTK